MNRKYIVTLGLIFIFVVFVVLYLNDRHKSSKGEIEISKIEESNVLKFDENTGYYYIIDNESGEILSASKSKDDLTIYVDNPDYKGNPLISKPTSLDEYLLMLTSGPSSEENKQGLSE